MNYTSHHPLPPPSPSSSDQKALTAQRHTEVAVLQGHDGLPLKSTCFPATAYATGKRWERMEVVVVWNMCSELVLNLFGRFWKDLRKKSGIPIVNQPSHSHQDCSYPMGWMKHPINMGLNIGSHWIPLNINISGETSRRSPLGEHGGHGAPHRTCQPTISRRRGESGVRWHSRVYINIDR